MKIGSAPSQDASMAIDIEVDQNRKEPESTRRGDADFMMAPRPPADP